MKQPIEYFDEPDYNNLPWVTGSVTCTWCNITASFRNYTNEEVAANILSFLSEHVSTCRLGPNAITAELTSDNSFTAKALITSNITRN